MTEKIKNALIVFVRKPELGKVKTRLAKALGQDKALEIYKKLLLHTESQIRNISADKFVYYEGATETNDIWDNDIYIKKKQVEDSLGGKMAEAFRTVFSKGYNQVLIVGSDCAELTSAVINAAIMVLSSHDMVLGPAKDGGFYLLGMNKMNEALFSLESYSHAKVAKDTLTIADENGITYACTLTLSDVDEVEDVPQGWL